MLESRQFLEGQIEIENQESFFARLRSVLPRSEYNKVRKAYYLAKYGHRWQKRKEIGPDGELLRYFEHLRRVTLNLIDGLHCLDVDMLCAGLLHDAVEDTKELDIDFIEDAFGVEVARLVIRLSKVPEAGYHERLVGGRDWRVLAIKLCGDNLDNMRSLGQTDGTFQRKQIAETDEKYLPLFPRLLALAPESYRADIGDVQQEMNAIVVGYKRQFLLEEVPDQVWPC